MPRPPQNLVVFDLGRVLIRICDNWSHACTVAGFQLPPQAASTDPAARAHRDQLDQHFHDYDCGRIDLPTFAAQVAPARGLTPDQVIALNNVYIRGPFPGAADLLDDLHAAGHSTACLSNTNANHWATLTDPTTPNGPVLARLTHRFASHLAGLRKPDPAIYEHLEHQTGAHPSDITFFDDIPENVQAAQHRGWTAHLVQICENPIPAVRAALRAANLLT